MSKFADEKECEEVPELLLDGGSFLSEITGDGPEEEKRRVRRCSDRKTDAGCDRGHGGKVQ